MFNLWNRSYVQTISERDVFDTLTIFADPDLGRVVFITDDFRDGGKLIQRASSIKELLDEHYQGNIANLFAQMRLQADSKWSIVVNRDDYHYILGCYLKEVQYAYQLEDSDLHFLAFTHVYDDLCYIQDASVTKMIADGVAEKQIKEAFKSYTPSGILQLTSPSELPTELAYFLAVKSRIDEAVIGEKFIAPAMRIVKQLKDVRDEDFFEWLMLDTKTFLNAMKSELTPAIEVDEFTLSDVMSYIQGDATLKTMLFQPLGESDINGTWVTRPDFKQIANQLLNAWERMVAYLSNNDKLEWVSDYVELMTPIHTVRDISAAVRYVLELDGAPTVLDKPLVELFGYDVLSQHMDTKYNRTLLLATLKGTSPTFDNFVKQAFVD